MADGNKLSVRVLSKGFQVWKAKEVQLGTRITLDSVVAETGLAQMTVRKHLIKDGKDVTGSSLESAAKLAHHFGVGLDDLVEIHTTES